MGPSQMPWGWRRANLYYRYRQHFCCWLLVGVAASGRCRCRCYSKAVGEEDSGTAACQEPRAVGEKDSGTAAPGANTYIHSYMCVASTSIGSIAIHTCLCVCGRWPKMIEIVDSSPEVVLSSPPPSPPTRSQNQRQKINKGKSHNRLFSSLGLM